MPFSKIEAQGILAPTDGCIEIPQLPEPPLWPNCQGELVYDYVVGTATQYPSSAALGSVPSGSKILIFGNFYINNDYTLDGATISITKNSIIILQQRLTLNSCVLFACTRPWKGIYLQPGSFLKSSQSRIMDALTAVNCTNSNAASLEIEGTTFQNNVTDMYFSHSPTLSNFPVINVFSGNDFLFSDVSIYVSGMPLKLPKSSARSNFHAPRYGILAEGSPLVSVQNLNFYAVRDKGISIDEGGSIIAAYCDFYNTNNICVSISTCYGADFSNSSFNYDAYLPVPTAEGIYRYGIKIDEMAPGCTINIRRNCEFNADFTDMTDEEEVKRQLITGIFINGNNTGTKAKVNIGDPAGFFYGNDFNLNAMYARGIHLSGSFPSSCQIKIWNNSFLLNCQYPTYNYFSPIGILCNNGSKSNLNIRDNQFSKEPGQDLVYGMELSGSKGESNTVANNIIGDGNYFDAREYDHGIRLINFKNTIICSNYFYGGNSNIFAQGQNDGTKLIYNHTTKGRLVRIQGFSYIGDQFSQDPNSNAVQTYDNTWYYENAFGLLLYNNPQALCYGSPGLSKFIVQTPQSENPVLANAYFSEYHPYSITPDNNNQWFTYEPNATSIGSDCYLGFSLDNVSKLTADGALSEYDGNPVFTWEAESYLYKSLVNHDELANTYAAYPGFKASKQYTNIGKLYSVEKSIDEAHSNQEGLATLIVARQDAASTPLKQIGVLEDSMLNATDPNALQVWYTQRAQRLEELVAIYLSIDSLLAVYESNILAAYTTIAANNSAINSNLPHELYLKTGYAAFLAKYSHPERVLPDSLKVALLNIAQLCPRTAGYGVYFARGLVLPTCDSVVIIDDSDECYPVGGEEYEQKGAVNVATVRKGQGNIDVYPNPASNSFTVTTGRPMSGQVFLLDATGRVVAQKYFSGTTKMLHFDGHRTAGLYRILIRYEDGTSAAANLIISQ